MTKRETINVPKVKPEIKIDEATRQKLLNAVKEESLVIIHCSYTGSFWYDRIRIWKSTFLVDKNSAHKSKLVHTENIALYPTWSQIEIGQTINFTLVFTGLPKHCRLFDLIEEIPEPGGFHIMNIERNNSDVYLIDMHESK
jgi:hypothetical protein